MRKTWMLCILLFTILTTFAQKNVADSFLRDLRAPKTNSLQTQTVLKWMDKVESGLFDSGTYYPTQIVQTGQQQSNTDLRALGHANLKGRVHDKGSMLQHHGAS